MHVPSARIKKGMPSGMISTIPLAHCRKQAVINSNQTCLNDPIIFTGGSGRFEGAEGMAYTNAFVHDGADEWRTDFFSTGSLTLVKGKR